jgi:hypothetical protein
MKEQTSITENVSNEVLTPVSNCAIVDCVHINRVVTKKHLEDKGWFIPGDIKKLHLTFNSKN